GAPERSTRGPVKRGSGSGGVSRPRHSAVGASASRCGVASSFGRYCFALRGRTIRVVVFRASHPAKPPSRQRRFVQRFLKYSMEKSAVPCSSREKQTATRQ